MQSSSMHAYTKLEHQPGTFIEVQLCMAYLLTVLLQASIPCIHMIHNNYKYKLDIFTSNLRFICSVGNDLYTKAIDTTTTLLKSEAV